MCGVTGFWADPTGALPAVARLRPMVEALRHRGPDAQGEWIDAEAGLALGHTRLAIVDLSPAGAQPMESADGRWVLSYNGELYNADELARELGLVRRGHSDTEVLVEAIARLGVRAALERSWGMFAGAAWDRRERRLSLFRDRLGKKPLLFAAEGGVLRFGSELSALRASGLPVRIDRDALGLYLRYGVVPAPLALVRGVQKLEPGTVATFAAPGAPPRVERYWDARAVARRGAAAPFAGSADEAVTAVSTLIDDAVRRRTVADVPLGAFLSGGVDSSVVVASLQAQSRARVRTFTVGFDDPRWDEAPFAAAVARHLGTEHTELRLTAAEAQGAVRLLPAWLDEPFADSSLLPTWLVARLARRHVTVALSGDGGDELFGGYHRHRWVPRLWRLLGRLPGPARRALTAPLGRVPRERWDALARVLPPGVRPRLLGDKLHKVAALGGALSADAVHLALLAAGAAPLGVPVARDPWADALLGDPTPLPERTLLRDLVTYLPDDILTKLDRATMAVALEGRVPLLDHRLVELAWSLPSAVRLPPGPSKPLLRQVLERRVPRALFERPKAGFAVPLGDWLRGPLRDWGQALIDAPAEDGLDPRAVRALWEEHQAGRSASDQPVWAVLVLRGWLGARGATGA